MTEIKYSRKKKYTKADMVLDVVSVVGATILLGEEHETKTEAGTAKSVRGVGETSQRSRPAR